MFRRILTAALVAALPGVASASAIISDGNVVLGVDDFGQLNVRGGVPDVFGTREVGVRWVAPGGAQYESTSHGCLCEGWGLSVDGTVGSANNDDGGASGMTLDSFTSTATTAQSVVSINSTDVKVTHDFQLSASDDLYEAIVTIENTGTTDVSDLVYRRVFDWDTSPTPFNEFVTIRGTGTTTLLKASSNNGFTTSNPTVALSMFGTCPGGGLTQDFTACGPRDHGSAFDFALGGLDAGEKFSFSIFYGGAANLSDAEDALGEVGAELFSLGWSGTDANQDGFNDSTGAVTPTFIFGFKGVGGTIIIPDPTPPTTPPTTPPGVIPLPAGAWLMIGGLAALGALRQRRKAA